MRFFCFYSENDFPMKTNTNAKREWGMGNKAYPNAYSWEIFGVNKKSCRTRGALRTLLAEPCSSL